MVTNFNLGAGLNGQALAQEAVWRLPGLAVTLVTGNSEAFDDYRLRSWKRLISKPSVGADLVEAACGLRQPHQHDRLAATPTCLGQIAEHNPEDRRELA